MILPMKIITLLTDFGSFYPAAVKGVILSQARDVTFVDIAHDIPPQDVRAGAFALFSTARYFPSGTIHLAVVDPGVGSERLSIAIESGGHYFVGPDNGLLMPAARSLGTPRAHEIALDLHPSPTFHGRDVFAPAVALLVQGRLPQDMGPEIRPKELSFGMPRRTKKGIEVAVIYADRFGNLITNMRKLPPFPVRLKGIKLKVVETYSKARRIEPLITVGSHGFLEIAVNKGSAAEAFGLKAGDRIELEERHCSE
jgi:S-adenosylmethionine hydrolase